MNDASSQAEPDVSDADDALVVVRGVTKTYTRGKQTVHALSGVDLDIEAGEYVSIMGPSGSGKSTLFNLVGALDKPTAGDIRIGGLSLPTLSATQLAYVRCKHIGYVFQAYNLIASLTALKNVALPAVFGGASVEEADERAKAQLESVGLGHRLDHRPGELSGGQQQRVAIARALVNEPALILADEPTANLDLVTGSDIIELFADLSKNHGVTVVSTTHDHQMLAACDRVVWVRDGKIERIAAASELGIEAGSITAH